MNLPVAQRKTSAKKTTAKRIGSSKAFYASEKTHYVKPRRGWGGLGPVGSGFKPVGGSGQRVIA